jgi:hypothetical protein
MMRGIHINPQAGSDHAAAVLAWETSSRPWGGLIQPLPARAKRTLCLDAIDLCLRSFPLDDVLGANSASLARRAVDLLGKPADDPGTEFSDVLRALRDGDHSPTATRIVTALTEFSEALPGGLAACDVLVVLSACYEAVLCTGPSEQALTDLITAQRRLIDAAALA